MENPKNEAVELKNAIDAQIEAKGAEINEGVESKAAELKNELATSVEELKNENIKLQSQIEDVDKNIKSMPSFGIGKNNAKNEFQEFLLSKKEDMKRAHKGAIFSLELKDFANGQAGRASAIYGDERVSMIQFDPNYQNRLSSYLAGGVTSQTGAIRYSQETVDTVEPSGSTTAAAKGAAVGQYNKAKSADFAEANKTLTDVHVPIQTMGVYTAVAEEWLDDTQMLESYLSTRLGGDLGDAKDRQILRGTGAGNQFSGLNTGGISITTDAQVGSFANAVDNANRYDVLTAMASRLARFDFNADLCILHPDDYYLMTLIKGTTQEYVLQQTIAPNGTYKTFWNGVEIVKSNAQVAGRFTILDSQKASAYWSREGMTVEFERNGDDFINNAYTVRAKCRGAVTNYRPNGIATGTFTAVAALLEQP